MSSTLLQVMVGGLLPRRALCALRLRPHADLGMMNVVNFAHGDFVMLAMYTAFVLYRRRGSDPQRRCR